MMGNDWINPDFDVAMCIVWAKKLGVIQKKEVGLELLRRTVETVYARIHACTIEAIISEW